MTGSSCVSAMSAKQQRLSGDGCATVNLFLCCKHNEDTCNRAAPDPLFARFSGQIPGPERCQVPGFSRESWVTIGQAGVTSHHNKDDYDKNDSWHLAQIIEK